MTSAFFAVLRRWVQQHRHGLVTTDDFRQCVEDVTGDEPRRRSSRAGSITRRSRRWPDRSADHTGRTATLTTRPSGPRHPTRSIVPPSGTSAIHPSPVLARCGRWPDRPALRDRRPSAPPRPVSTSGRMPRPARARRRAPRHPGVHPPRARRRPRSPRRLTAIGDGDDARASRRTRRSRRWRARSAPDRAGPRTGGTGCRSLAPGRRSRSSAHATSRRGIPCGISRHARRTDPRIRVPRSGLGQRGLRSHCPITPSARASRSRRSPSRGSSPTDARPRTRRCRGPTRCRDTSRAACPVASAISLRMSGSTGPWLHSTADLRDPHPLADDASRIGLALFPRVLADQLGLLDAAADRRRERR